MSRSVPTLLGIMIILMVVMLVMLIYDYRLTSGLASGAAVVGTVGGQLLTGADQPDGQAAQTSAARTSAGALRVSPGGMQREGGTPRRAMQAPQQGAAHRGRTPSSAQSPNSHRARRDATRKPGT